MCIQIRSQGGGLQQYNSSVWARGNGRNVKKKGGPPGRAVLYILLTEWCVGYCLAERWNLWGLHLRDRPVRNKKE
eukprot:scaffold35592_cov19-Tisochrysis_lutea.AAC.3